VVSTGIKRATLDDAYDASVTASLTLRAQLRLYETAARAAITTGQIVATVSQSNAAGGRSTSFSTPGSEGISPVRMVELWRELIDLNDQVVADLDVDDNEANRLAIKNEMMGLLKPVTEHYGDFSLLRTGHAAPV
jgi:hypothetical protein